MTKIKIYKFKRKYTYFTIKTIISVIIRNKKIPIETIGIFCCFAVAKLYILSFNLQLKPSHL